jgi:hypothetical protein
MGAKFSLTKLVGLDCTNNCIKYVLNDCSCHSQCSECCEFEVETHPVELSSDDVDVDVDLSEGELHIHA